ncbi:MAG TPA: AMP-binding protein [Acidimicrobiia bacterium]|nr:AMP-binding protein [Acidimicrobiia bacterium]
MRDELLIADIFRTAARAAPDRVAAWRGDASITFGEIERRANQHAHALRARGVHHRDRVVTWNDTTLDVIPLFAALARLGAVFVPISPLLSPGEAAAMVAAARPVAIAADAGRAADAATVAADAGVVCVELAGFAAGEDESDVDEPALRETDPHVVFFTSGSTGRPKGAVVSHRVNVLRTHPGALLEPRGAQVAPFPLFHMGAWTMALQQWQARRAIVFTTADPEAICDAIEQHRATHVHCLPGVWRRLLDYLGTPAGSGRDLSSVLVADAATSATPLELLAAIDGALPNARVRVFYGSTEAGAVTSLPPEDVYRKPGSVGVPGVLTEVRVEPDGELAVSGPLLFDGYLDDPEATAAALQDGWYRTGDVVDVDDEGYLSVIGRARDVIRTGGETVAPPEVEAVLAEHPAVADVAVVGIPDAQWGEIVCAVIVLVPGAVAPTLDEVRAHTGATLARFKVPRRVEVVDAIPRTPATQQVQRRLLVEQLS